MDTDKCSDKIILQDYAQYLTAFVCFPALLRVVCCFSNHSSKIIVK